jgi:hypothetical protein
MRGLLSLAAAVAFVGSILVMRTVVHGYSDHGHLDLFHLAIGIAAGVAGMFFLGRVFAARRT